MITTLTDTTASAIDKKMTEMRETFGVTTIGRVLTLLIIATGDDTDDAVEAAVSASHEHPSRVIVVVGDETSDADEAGLDAEIRLGRDAGAGEIIILHPRGAARSSLDTLVMPLLLPDAPIVTWWPGTAPSSPVHDVLGSMSQRRITDAARCADPLAMLKRLRRGYAAGDSDLAWARLTRLRGILASALESPAGAAARSVTISGAPEDPCVVLLGAWLVLALDVPVDVQEPEDAQQDGIDARLRGVRIERDGDSLELKHISDEDIELTHGGDQEPQRVSMPRRTLYELLAEELRRLDPDEVYGDVLAHAFPGIEDPAVFAQNKPTPTDRIEPDADTAAVAAARDAAEHLAQALRERPQAHLVLTGGGMGTRTAAALPPALDEEKVDLSCVHVWWGDERFVQLGTADRNDEGVRESFLEPLLAQGLLPEHVHRMPSPGDGMSLEEAAAWYGQQLDSAGGDQPFRTRGSAFFDVLMLGVGPDGHVASLFPQHPDQRETAASAVAVESSPKPPAQRISMTWPVLNSAQHVQLFAVGAQKATAAAAGHREIDPIGVPASAVRGLTSTTWYMDPEAAGRAH